jgi:polynucleotide 5'-hydroxyl-kinase GRC3/NOL9
VFVGGCCDPPEWAYVEDAYIAGNSAERKRSTFVDIKNTPWVEERTRMDDMGYLNTVRRVRKFQT